MKHSILFTIAVSLALTTATAHADTVTDWNVTAHEVTKVARVGGAPRVRAFAMMHVAMSDAINSVQEPYTRYIAGVPVVPGASPEAAAAAAARQILVQLFPGQKAMIDEAYATSVKAIPEGTAKTEGVALGERIATAVQAERSADGTSVPDTYRPLTNPGIWVPTTPPAAFQYARAKPWAMKSADQFRPARHRHCPARITPALTTRRSL